MKSKTNKEVEFEIQSGRIIVTDPCYKLDTGCTKVLKVKNGIWAAEAEYINHKFESCTEEYTCIKALHAWHSDFLSIKDIHPHRTAHDIGVDSGQAGFFDFEKYKFRRP